MEQPQALSVSVDFGPRSYRIMIGHKLIRDASIWEGVGSAECAAIVSNTTVGPLYANVLATSLTGRFDRVIQIELPDGEEYKNSTSLNLIFDHLLSTGADRDTIMFALGGGVVGDVAGFAAACYMRGIRFVQVPTTLLAQVDSSVGGKTGINHPLGKNMIGAFHQPLLVVADLDTLATLPKREFSAGLAEVIKYGPIMDAGFLDWIEANIDLINARDAETLQYIVRRSCELKARVIVGDEHESGQRAILNFGHTFGHAIESGLGYGVWMHGEAVGCGMVMAVDLSARLGFVSSLYAARLTQLIARAGLPITGPRFGADRYVELMRHDKKTKRGEMRFVVIEDNGRASVRPVPEGLVREIVDLHS